MWYWFAECKRLEKIDSLKTEIIAEYKDQTGVSARSREDLMKAFEIKNDVGKQCQFELSETLDKNKKLTIKKNFWKVTTFVCVPVGITAGAIAGGYLVMKFKQQ